MFVIKRLLRRTFLIWRRWFRCPRRWDAAATSNTTTTTTSPTIYCPILTTTTPRRATRTAKPKYSLSRRATTAFSTSSLMATTAMPKMGQTMLIKASMASAITAITISTFYPRCSSRNGRGVAISLIRGLLFLPNQRISPGTNRPTTICLWLRRNPAIRCHQQRPSYR